MGIRSSKYGWNFIYIHCIHCTGGFNSDWNTVFPRSYLMCSSCFSAGFFPKYQHSVSRISALRDCSCQIDRRQSKWKYRSRLKTWATILENAIVWNTQTCEYVATWTRQTSHIWPCLLPVFRYRYCENGTFSTINISKTIAGATVPIESLINKLQGNVKLDAKRLRTSYLKTSYLLNTRETNAVRSSLKTQKKNQHLGQTHL